MVRLAEASGIARVGLPRIGAGLGGLDWAVVRALLQSIGETTTGELVVCETFAR
jgi:O-acetyl-ADP-ribose deacetylase (regulator of RNase III)